VRIRAAAIKLSQRLRPRDTRLDQADGPIQLRVLECLKEAAIAADLVNNRAVDSIFQHRERFAIGAADVAHFFQIVPGFEHVALLGLPHAVIRPSHSVIGISSE
jgi:hypothetical protein